MEDCNPSTDTSPLINWLWLSFFSLFWLVPQASRALLHRPAPLTPPIIDNLTGFCLFPVSQDYVPVQYIQLLLPGATEWITAEEGEYFSMSPFGARIRLEEMIRKRLASRRSMAEVASFVRERYAREEGVSLVGVRFVSGVVLLGQSPPGPLP